MLATAPLDAIGAARIVSGTNDMVGTHLTTANFGLRWIAFNRLGTSASDLESMSGSMEMATGCPSRPATP
jgi:hypothetical protein